jgi:hypothetical protein
MVFTVFTQVWITASERLEFELVVRVADKTLFVSAQMTSHPNLTQVMTGHQTYSAKVGMLRCVTGATFEWRVSLEVSCWIESFRDSSFRFP